MAKDNALLSPPMSLYGGVAWSWSHLSSNLHGAATLDVTLYTEEDGWLPPLTSQPGAPQQVAASRASNECSRRFHNHGEGPN